MVTRAKLIRATTHRTNGSAYLNLLANNKAATVN